ncbi:hypothetical protein ACFW2Y_30890 [Streptomyces sp. NPDC058877]|uniref:hypothetical protein n=1 Tax=Streptomyces sp. NPDC058877 TaxID=3346665 RepID=UPI0036B27F82
MPDVQGGGTEGEHLAEAGEVLPWVVVEGRVGWFAGDETHEGIGDEVTGDEVTGDEVTGDEVTGDEVTGDEVTWRRTVRCRVRNRKVRSDGSIGWGLPCSSEAKSSAVSGQLRKPSGA